jgi:hypothetical protein
MKHIIILLFSAVILSCNNDKKTSGDKIPGSSDSSVRNDSVIAGSNNNFTDLLDNYLLLKNALVNDNSKDAATAASGIRKAIEKMEGTDFSETGKKAFESVRLEIAEHANHISDSKNDIAHQREHFDLLSQDLLDLIKGVGSDRVLYRTFCPMYNNKKGAEWLSEVKEVRNPYYGQEMLTCGEVKEEISINQ